MWPEVIIDKFMKVIMVTGQGCDEHCKGHKSQKGEKGLQGHQISKVMEVMSMSIETDHCNVIFVTLLPLRLFLSEGPFD